MSESLNPENSALQPLRTRKVGRGVFLGLSGTTAAVVALRANGVKIPVLSGITNALGNLVPGTNVNGFTIYTINGFPAFDASTYRLTIDGLVDDPREYTFKDLLAMPEVRETRYYQCVTGWVVPRPRWRGVRLWDLVQASKPKTAGAALSFSCLDNAYTESLTFKQAQKPDVLLAYGLDGKALSRDQGRPLRLVVPGMYGYKYAKWVNRITVTDNVIPGYWENNGYDVDAYIGRSNGA